MCEIEGCERVINRDGLCFPHKIKTVNMEIADLKRDNREEGAFGNMGQREGIRQMYESRRAAGMTDPLPENSKAAKYAPAVGVHGGKKYREQNGGL